MLTLGVSAAEVQQALTLVLAIVFIFTGVSAFLTTRRKTRSCSGFLHGLPLVCQTVEWFVIQPGCCDGLYCICSSRRVAHVRCTGQYTADFFFFFCFFAGVIAPVMSTSTVAVWISTS